MLAPMPAETRLRAASDWTDLVFHVLAHVDASEVPANLWSPEYVRHVAGAHGPAQSRPLGASAAALAASVRTHAEWARLQHVAWLFADHAQAQAAALIDLAALPQVPHARRAPLHALAPVLPAAELLRATALLEAEVHAALPAPVWERAALEAELGRARVLAPRLASAPLLVAPALTHHGRVYGGAIWIGAPAPVLAVSAGHVALQAAHEATVLEVGEAAAEDGTQLHERRCEAIAVVLLAVRAAAQGRSAEHAAWGRRWRLRRDHFARAGLHVQERALLDRLLTG
jgi:hypothetical protein